MKGKQVIAIIIAAFMIMESAACGTENSNDEVSAEQETKNSQTEIESTLDISNNDEITWSYDS